MFISYQNIKIGLKFEFRKLGSPNEKFILIVMRITKPEAVGHIGFKNTRHAIYTVDFQPTGNRLATGGGGNDY
jgi:hypothetical protein